MVDIIGSVEIIVATGLSVLFISSANSMGRESISPGGDAGAWAFVLWAKQITRSRSRSVFI